MGKEFLIDIDPVRFLKFDQEPLVFVYCFSIERCNVFVAMDFFLYIDLIIKEETRAFLM